MRWTERPELILVVRVTHRERYRVIDVKAGPRTAPRPIGTTILALVSRSLEHALPDNGRYATGHRGGSRFALPGCLTLVLSLL